VDVSATVVGSRRRRSGDVDEPNDNGGARVHGAGTDHVHVNEDQGV